MKQHMIHYSTQLIPTCLLVLVATQANTGVGLTSTIKDLITTINDSTTSVDMNGQIQQVPRMRLAGVRSRYEVW